MSLLRMVRRTVLRPLVVFSAIATILFTLYTYQQEGERGMNGAQPDHARRPFEWTNSHDRPGAVAVVTYRSSPPVQFYDVI